MLPVNAAKILHSVAGGNYGVIFKLSCCAFCQFAWQLGHVCQCLRKLECGVHSYSHVCALTHLHV